MFRLVAVVVLFCFASCKPPEMYGKEYVLYDSRWQENSAQPASRPESAPEGPVERIFALERDLAEIDRAIADGLDEDGTLGARRVGMAAEVAELKRLHGEAYEAERRKRLERLR